MHQRNYSGNFALMFLHSGIKSIPVITINNYKLNSVVPCITALSICLSLCQSSSHKERHNQQVLNVHICYTQRNSNQHTDSWFSCTSFIELCLLLTLRSCIPIVSAGNNCNYYYTYFLPFVLLLTYTFLGDLLFNLCLYQGHNSSCIHSCLNICFIKVTNYYLSKKHADRFPNCFYQVPIYSL